VRDDAGRITHKTEIVSGTTVNLDYTYDAAGHLATVKQDGTLTATYHYDTNGNRLEKVSPAGTDAGTFDSQDRCLTYGGTAYTYSANGELDTAANSAGTSSFRYDELGNLLGATLANGTAVDYAIDGTDRRVGRTVNGQRVQRLLYSGMHPVAELDAQGNVISRFVYATRQNIPDLIIKGDVTYRVVADHLGSPRLIVNVADGTIGQRMDFDEFGNVTRDTAPGFRRSSSRAASEIGTRA
jgi:YD repeat-containing protein